MVNLLKLSLSCTLEMGELQMNVNFASIKGWIFKGAGAECPVLEPLPPPWHLDRQALLYHNTGGDRLGRDANSALLPHRASDPFFHTEGSKADQGSLGDPGCRGYLYPCELKRVLCWSKTGNRSRVPAT